MLICLMIEIHCYPQKKMRKFDQDAQRGKQAFSVVGSKRAVVAPVTRPAGEPSQVLTCFSAFFPLVDVCILKGCTLLI